MSASGNGMRCVEALGGASSAAVTAVSVQGEKAGEAESDPDTGICSMGGGRNGIVGPPAAMGVLTADGLREAVGVENREEDAVPGTEPTTAPAVLGGGGWCPQTFIVLVNAAHRSVRLTCRFWL